MTYAPKCTDCHKPSRGMCGPCKRERRRMRRVRLEQYAMRKPEDVPVIRDRVEKYRRLVELGIELFA